MGEFGWAYISGSDLSAAQGIDGSVQVRKIGGTAFSGSESLTYDANNNLRVTGTVLVQGISASRDFCIYFLGRWFKFNRYHFCCIANDGANDF